MNNVFPHSTIAAAIIAFGYSFVCDAATPKPAPLAWSTLKYAYAKAYTYNFESFGPGAKGLFAYGPLSGKQRGTVGMHPEIRNERQLTSSEATHALALVHQTEGAARVSKCAFPRHAVVFFDVKDQPLASVNVCFECGDILVWPKWDKKPSRTKTMHRDKFMEQYEATMAHWTQFFQSMGNMPPDWTAATTKPQEVAPTEDRPKLDIPAAPEP